jgi:hypothetical protein
LEQQAFTLGAGPCYDALHRHAPVLIADLALGRERVADPAPRGIRSSRRFPPRPMPPKSRAVLVRHIELPRIGIRQE